LLRQMIGRGARKAPGKDSFWVVDFADNLQRHRDRALRARTLLPVEDAGARGRPYRPPPRHVAPSGQPRFENLAVPGHGTVPVAVGQTFGVEIELTSPWGVPRQGRAWEATARDIIQRLRETARAPVWPLPLDYDASCPTWWVVKYDSS